MKSSCNSSIWFIVCYVIRGLKNEVLVEDVILTARKNNSHSSLMYSSLSSLQVERLVWCVGRGRDLRKSRLGLASNLRRDILGFSQVMCQHCTHEMASIKSRWPMSRQRVFGVSLPTDFSLCRLSRDKDTKKNIPQQKENGRGKGTQEWSKAFKTCCGKSDALQRIFYRMIVPFR